MLNFLLRVCSEYYVDCRSFVYLFAVICMADITIISPLTLIEPVHSN